MKKMITFALCAAMTLTLAACGDKTKNSDTPNTPDKSDVAGEDSTEISSDFTDCETMEEASELAGFEISVPDSVDGYGERVIRAAEGKMLEIIYRNEESGDSVRIRKAAGDGDISGDFNSYAESAEVVVDDLEVTMKGNDKTVSLAVWTSGDYAYSISAVGENAAMEQTEMEELVRVLAGKTEKDGADSLPGGGSVEIPNPFVNCETTDEAGKLAGFEIAVPEELAGYDGRAIRAMEDSMIEIIYQNSESGKEVRVRKGTGSEDISGDFNSYAETESAVVDDLQVTLKGEDGNVSVATWTDGTYAFSITTDVEMDTDSMTELIRNVK